MKQIFALIFFCSAFCASAQKVEWMTFEEAIAAQQKVPKKIFMDVYTLWCGPCKILDVRTFQNPDVADYINENYYAVKFNAEGKDVLKFKGQTFENPDYVPNKNGRNGTHQFTRYMGVSAYPSMVFMSEKGEFIMPLVGYHTPQQLELYLKMISQDDYLAFTTSEDFVKYRDNFVPKFKD